MPLDDTLCLIAQHQLQELTRGAGFPGSSEQSYGIARQNVELIRNIQNDDMG